MEQAQAAFQEIEESFDALRRAVEHSDYGALDSLLQRQRELLQSAPASDPRTQRLALRGRELAHWAITMVKIQRSGYARSLAAILNSKHLDSNYTDAPPECADLISLQA